MAIAAAVGLFVAIVLRLAGTPEEIAGVDCAPGEPATLTLAAAPSSTLGVWSAYAVDLAALRHPPPTVALDTDALA